MTEILKEARFQQTLAELSSQTGESMRAVSKKASKYLGEMVAVHHPMSNLIMPSVIESILSRGYDKTIDVNPLELRQLSRTMRRHSVAFVMTHKTYIDMIVLATVLDRHGLGLPFIFAGANLSFLGLGQVGQQSGVIFIRRSFNDNLIYKATLRHYIATLINEKSHFMWAIEGTRSRTGKVVWPKMGILKYIMDGAQESGEEVKYVPVSIVYDLIPDVKEMTLQGRGKQKSAESLSWLMGYLRKLGDKFGRISLRIGEPLNLSDVQPKAIAHDFNTPAGYRGTVPRLAFKLVLGINDITPVTTTSLVCNVLLSKYALTKRAIESDIADLMPLIETHNPNALVDRGTPIGKSVQEALDLLTRAKIIDSQGDSLYTKYRIVSENYLSATYYANMAVHHLYQRAFIELSVAHVANTPPVERSLAFWTEIMALRDLFKFEFFYSSKPQFSDEIEADLTQLWPEWQMQLPSSDVDLLGLLRQQKVLVAPTVLHTYVEAYRVVAHGLQTWQDPQPFDKELFVQSCLELGEQMHWQGQIQRIEAVSKPFLINGIRLAQNRGLIPTPQDRKREDITQFLGQLDNVAERIKGLQGILLSRPAERSPAVPVERDIVPGSKTSRITANILESEAGPHIGAFFDVDRTLINGFSAQDFMQTRLLSGQMTTREAMAQFAGVLIYTLGNRNFGGLASVGAMGVAGIGEQVFIEVGEETYRKHLAKAIFPESRALVAAHMAKGHTVAIVSAATPYQVNPIARDLGIEHVMCTRMEVKKGRFTGQMIEPTCWGEGKAHAGHELAKQFNLDLSKSYFYTDSAQDMPLLEIVGHPRPLNPDTELSAIGFEHDWPVYRFSDESRPGVTDIVRTGLTAGTLIPAAMLGTATGALTLSWRDGINAMVAMMGELGTAMAGIKLVVKGEENLWAQRPAVFVFNHQSQADFFIASKLLKKNIQAIAKKELLMTPVGPLLWAAGVIFIDRGNRKKAIAALEPAVEALKNGTSIAIAPEGTRSYDYTLGRFKKGAFHMAMQAGVPIVPLVIKNAHDAMPRGATFFRPAAVEVVVLPPIPTDTWEVSDLNEHVAYVRSLFLQELGQSEELQTV
ncbi:MAG: HAD-IB family hydrolase [Ardenticatenaceae bacterium]